MESYARKGVVMSIFHHGLLLAASSGDTDPNFADVSLLLHFDGTNGGTTFTDHSSYAHSVAFRQSVTTSTTQSKFGGAAGFFNGNHYLTYTSAAEFDLTTGDFTVETWFYATSLSTAAVIVTKASGTGFYAFRLEHNLSGQLQSRAFDTANAQIYTITDAGAMSNNTWYHIALTRNGSTFTLWRDGVSVGTATSSASLRTNSGDPIAIGELTNSSSAITGYLDDLRITKGVCRYTSTFTPPTAALPNS